MHTTPTNRRGAALVIALATLVVAVAATTTLARLAGTWGQDRRFEEWTRTADDLELVAEGVIESWLASESETVVLPLETETPVVAVLHELWEADVTRGELRISAWDQQGMVPMGPALSGVAVRMTLPPAVRSALDDLDLRRAGPPGLDMFPRSDQVHGYPWPPPSAPDRFGRAGPVQDSLQRPQRPAIGAWVGTHNPAGAINVNTAPLDLLRGALREAGVGGIERILEARAKLEHVSDVAVRPTDGGPQTAMALTSQSTAWAFRVDVHVHSVGRSWWLVYSKNAEWECVQRLAIGT